ncbi:non-ribosomal peptide synthetase [Streptomyces sp. 6N223]|uniref:non-ribosomal peptide synthetase n=1 Tax=Streptomyces sp. 6N223 TaxID=3457412 RepID=UPI003FD5E49F
MWLLERLVPESTPNNLALAFRVEGRLSAPALDEALATLVRRYEVLRTVYFATGAELMKGVVAPEEFTVAIEEFDRAEKITPATPEVGEELGLALRPYLNQRFVFDGRPLLRAGLFHHPDGDVVCLAFHHLVYDIISGTALMEELVAAYEGIVDGGAPPAALLEPVAAFHEPEPPAESLAFWREQLEDFDPGHLDLWCGQPDAADPTLRGDQVVHVLSPETREIVHRLQRELRAPEAVVLLAAFNLLLAAHGAGPDITVGSPVSVRPREAPRAVGHHTNVLPLRLLVDPATDFRSLVRSARDTYFGALKHVGVPVDSISELVPRASSSWRNRLCRHLFNYFPQLEMTVFAIGGQRAWPVVVENGYSKFDLEFFVASSRAEIQVTARYSTEKLDHADARALLLRYEALLATLGAAGEANADRPTGELLLWSEEDRAVIDAANDTAREFDPANVLEAVHRHAGNSPRAVAVQQGDREVGYRQLWDAAVATRDALAASGVVPGDIVAIAAARSPELVATVLGVWLAGAAYLPVDPEHPAQRVTYLLTDSGARAVATDRELDLPGLERELTRLPLARIPDAGSNAGRDAGPNAGERAGEQAPPAPLVTPIDPEACAYLIYTSGSSGRPKGALIPHRAISNIAADYTHRLRATPADATLWMTTFAFDMANLEHYVPLYSGGRIVIAPDEARTDGRVLRELIDRHEPGIIQATPTTLRMVLDEVADRLAGRRVVTGAEPVPVTLARRLLAAGCEVINAYGPTETTTWCTWGVIPADQGERMSVGGPIWNTRMMVLAPDGRELPVGVRGEVCIAGHGVSLGYHGRPELNAERFGDHPRYGRFYRSGDTGRWLPDGTLELSGRADRQVKLRGNRIELGEIEATLLGHPGVRGAAAVVVGDRSADGRLVAFVEANALGAGASDLAAELWDYARAEIPRAAIPQDFVVVDALPTNANEKVDYLALEELARGRVAAAGRGATGEEAAAHASRAPAGAAGDDGADAADAPADELVRSLVELWQQLLDRDDIAPDANFFTHGGHSLLGARLVQEVEQTLGATVKLADLFEAPTPEALAAHIRAAREA